MSSSSAEETRDAFGRLAKLLHEEGRDPSEVTRSAMLGALVGRTRAEVRERTGDCSKPSGNPAETRKHGWPSGATAGW